jgi:hypothetical protein
VTGRDLLADGFLVAAFFPLLQVAFSLLPGTLGGAAGFGRRRFHARAARFRESDRDRAGPHLLFAA